MRKVVVSIYFVTGCKYTAIVVLVFLLLTLNYFTPFTSVSVINFEQVNIGWVGCITETLTLESNMGNIW